MAGLFLRFFGLRPKSAFPVQVLSKYWKMSNRMRLALSTRSDAGLYKVGSSGQRKECSLDQLGDM